MSTAATRRASQTAVPTSVDLALVIVAGFATGGVKPLFPVEPPRDGARVVAFAFAAAAFALAAAFAFASALAFAAAAAFAFLAACAVAELVGFAAVDDPPAERWLEDDAPEDAEGADCEEEEEEEGAYEEDGCGGV